jgi:hypothetical protein
LRSQSSQPAADVLSNDLLRATHASRQLVILGALENSCSHRVTLSDGKFLEQHERPPVITG